MRYVLGLGNYAMGDDSIGLRIIEHIADHNLDQGFEAIEVGNNGIQVLTYFTEDTEKIVLVDAVSFGGKPGDVIVFSPDEVVSEKIVRGISTHEGDILKLIELGTQLGQPIPPTRIVAIEPAQMDLDDGLSDTLQNRFDEYIRVVLKEVSNCM